MITGNIKLRNVVDLSCKIRFIIVSMKETYKSNTDDDVKEDLKFTTGL